MTGSRDEKLAHARDSVTTKRVHIDAGALRENSQKLDGRLRALKPPVWIEVGEHGTVRGFEVTIDGPSRVVYVPAQQRLWIETEAPIGGDLDG